MPRRQFNLDFRMMSLTYKFRDFRLPRLAILQEAGIGKAFQVLDYGCGPGSYIVPLAKLVGDKGKIYALDIHPLAIRTVQKIASRKRLANVQTIPSDCKTGLPTGSVDVALLYDILHDLANPERVLKELHRVLKPRGVLSVSDHHLKRDEIVTMITIKGWFKLSRQGERIHSFSKEETGCLHVSPEMGE